MSKFEPRINDYQRILFIYRLLFKIGAIKTNYDTFVGTQKIWRYVLQLRSNSNELP